MTVRTLTYAVRPGDGWIRIANLHAVTLARLLAENPGATTSTPLSVGRTVNVPAPVACWSCHNWDGARSDGSHGDCHLNPPYTTRSVPGQPREREYPTTIATDWCSHWTRT